MKNAHGDDHTDVTGTYAGFLTLTKSPYNLRPGSVINNLLPHSTRIDLSIGLGVYSCPRKTSSRHCSPPTGLTHHSSNMKPTSLLPLLAITIPTTFSQPHSPARDNTAQSAPLTPRSSNVPQACHDTNAVVYDQLQEISRGQSRHLPTTHDAAGYLYAVYSGRKMLGCPNEGLVSPSGNDSSAASEFKRSSSESVDPLGHNPAYGNPCDVVQILKDQVEDQMLVVEKNNIPTPDYLAGWYSGTQDLDDGLKCGLVHRGTASEDLKSMESEE